MEPPAWQDLVAAQPRVYAHLRRTPLLRHALLDEWLGCKAWVKHENHNPTGAFKIRGGVNLVAQLTAEERRRGVVSASTGNHGQSMALACRIHGVGCRIFVPMGNNPEKNAAMRALGAEVIEHGRDFDEARERVEELAPREGWRYVHSANEPQLIAGVGTYALEIFEELPEADYSLRSGGRRQRSRRLLHRARRHRVAGEDHRRPGRRRRRVCALLARPGARRQRSRAHVRRGARHARDIRLDILHPEAAARRGDDAGGRGAAGGRAAALALTHNLAEGAGAASLAAARKRGRALAGATVVCVMTGGNIDAKTLANLLRP